MRAMPNHIKYPSVEVVNCVRMCVQKYMPHPPLSTHIHHIITLLKDFAVAPVNLSLMNELI